MIFISSQTPVFLNIRFDKDHWDFFLSFINRSHLHTHLYLKILTHVTEILHVADICTLTVYCRACVYA